MKNDMIPFTLRFPAELRSRLDFAARSSGRSLNSEIVARLEESFGDIADRIQKARLREISEVSAALGSGREFIAMHTSFLHDRSLDAAQRRQIETRLQRSKERVRQLDTMLLHLQRDAEHLRGLQGDSRGTDPSCV